MSWSDGGEYDQPCDKFHRVIRHSRVSSCGGHTVCHTSAQHVAGLVVTNPAIEGPMCSWPVAKTGGACEHLTVDVQGHRCLSGYPILVHAQDGMQRFPMSSLSSFTTLASPCGLSRSRPGTADPPREATLGTRPRLLHTCHRCNIHVTAPGTVATKPATPRLPGPKPPDTPL